MTVNNDFIILIKLLGVKTHTYLNVPRYQTFFTKFFSDEYLDNGWKDIRKNLQSYMSNTNVSPWEKSFRYIKQIV